MGDHTLIIRFNDEDSFFMKDVRMMDVWCNNPFVILRNDFSIQPLLSNQNIMIKCHDKEYSKMESIANYCLGPDFKYALVINFNELPVFPKNQPMFLDDIIIDEDDTTSVHLCISRLLTADHNINCNRCLDEIIIINKYILSHPDRVLMSKSILTHYLSEYFYSNTLPPYYPPTH